MNARQRRAVRRFRGLRPPYVCLPCSFEKVRTEVMLACPCSRCGHWIRKPVDELRISELAVLVWERGARLGFQFTPRRRSIRTTRDLPVAPTTRRPPCPFSLAA